MAVDVNLTTVNSGYNTNIINNNFTAIQTALADALSRSGATPNTMSGSLDMNSQDIINAGNIASTTLTVGGTNIDPDLFVTAAELETALAEAAASASAASASADAAAAAYDSFDDRYLGSKSLDPTLDNDGDALLTGALYWNTMFNNLRVYNGFVWEIIDNIDLSNVTITGGTIDGTAIGGTTPAAGSFTSLSATGVVSWAKGADVASAGALTLGSDGNYFDITGTTAITSIATKGVGTIVKLHFDAALTLTHHATDLVLPTGANITTAAGDEAEFMEYATGDWRCTNYQRANGTALATGIDAYENLASAATTDLRSTSSQAVNITGTTTITAFGTSDAGTYRRGKFAGALTLTHNATSLILPGAANITTAANDTFEAVSLGSGNWIVVDYQKADGTVVAARIGSDGSGDSWLDFYDDNSDAWRSFGWDDSANAFVAEENDSGIHKLGLVSDTSSESETNYPIGTILAVSANFATFPDRNASRSIYLWTGGTNSWVDSSFGSLGSILTGTWRYKGATESGTIDRMLVQRVG